MVIFSSEWLKTVEMWILEVAAAVSVFIFGIGWVIEVSRDLFMYEATL